VRKASVTCTSLQENDSLEILLEPIKKKGKRRYRSMIIHLLDSMTSASLLLFDEAALFSTTVEVLLSGHQVAKQVES